MNDCGQRISALRKQHNLTQLELGNKLNVTAQAVSKWETGLSEPDIETLKKISALFGVSIDELLSNKTLTTVDNRTESVATAEKPEKVIVGECEKCKKQVAAGEYKIASITHHSSGRGAGTTYTTQHIYCNDCYKKHQEEEHRKYIQKTQSNARLQKEEIDQGFRRGTVWGIIAALVAIAVVIIAANYNNFSPVITAVLCAVSAYGFFAMVFQCFFDGYVLDILEFFTRSFRMPGFIFSLDIDSIILMILTKISLSILFGILSTMIFLVGVVVAAFCSLFTFPFALKKNFENRREAIASVEQANKLK